MENENKKSGGIGFTAALQLIFITLKLIGIIKWSWIWVLAPTWGRFIFELILVVIYFML